MVRLSSESSLSALTSEITKLQAASNQLLNTNKALAKEVSKLQDKVSKIQAAPATPAPKCAAPPPPPPPPPPATPALKCAAPPPPPPPPPPMTPLEKSSATPSGRKTSPKKWSTPLSSRPSITVEDLLKVTLKKPTSKELSRRNTVPGTRGPPVSLDMLRSVKLKSARCRSLEQHKSSLSSSALDMENSLTRVLESVDASRRAFRRVQPVVSDSTNKDTPPLAFAYCGSESVLV